jgi:hypothetical protein
MTIFISQNDGAHCTRTFKNVKYLSRNFLQLTTGWMIGVRIPAGAGNFSRHHVYTGSGAHMAFYPMGTGDTFLGGKAAGA